MRWKQMIDTAKKKKNITLGFFEIILKIKNFKGFNNPDNMIK